MANLQRILQKRENEYFSKKIRLKKKFEEDLKKIELQHQNLKHKQKSLTVILNSIKRNERKEIESSIKIYLENVNRNKTKFEREVFLKYRFNSVRILNFLNKRLKQLQS